jgi:hypothetical protein
VLLHRLLMRAGASKHRRKLTPQRRGRRLALKMKEPPQQSLARTRKHQITSHQQHREKTRNPHLPQHTQALTSLMQTADRALTAWHGAPHAGAREGVYPARERILFTTREKILTGDWEMSRAPCLPPTLRDPAPIGSSTPRTVAYDLPSILAGQ